MTVSLNRSGPLYAGTGLTITCNVTLDPSVNSGETVYIDWTSLGNIQSEKYNITPATSHSDSDTYSGSLTISPLALTDNGITFTCTGTVTGIHGSQGASNRTNVTVTVTG